MLQLTLPELFPYKQPLNATMLSTTDPQYCCGHLDTKFIKNEERLILGPKVENVGLTLKILILTPNIDPK